MAEVQPRPPGFMARQLAARPVVTNSATSGLISVIAELLRHWLTTEGNVPPDAANVMRQFAIGSMVVSPLATNWHALVERLFRKWQAGSHLTVLAKTAAEQTFFAPVINVAFMTSQGLLEGRSLEEVRLEVQDKFVEVMRGNFAFWVPTGLIQYKFVLPRYRVIFANLMSVVWTIYLISKTSKAAERKPEPSAVPAIKVVDTAPSTSCGTQVVPDGKVTDAPSPARAEAAGMPARPAAEKAALPEDTVPSPTPAPEREPAAEQLPATPDHQGEWVVDRTEGDWDAFLYEAGLSWVKRKVFAQMGYGKDRIRMTVRQDGDAFHITNVAVQTTNIKFRVGGGKQEGQTMEGKQALFLPSWVEGGQVLESPSWSMEGEDLANRRQFLQGGELVVDLISPKGVLARRVYRRA